MDQLVCLWGASASVYKGKRGEAGRPRRARQESPTPFGSRIPPPPNPSWNRIRGGGKRERERGRPPLLVLLGPREGRGARPMLGCLFSFPLGPTMAHIAPGGVPVTSRYSGKIPISPGTLPISKHRLPIYQSLRLDHFETPRHVCDHIRDSEQPSVHQNA